MEVKARRRRRGDRRDGRLLRSLDAFARVSPYVMVNRSGASNSFRDDVDIDTVERYIRHKRNDDGLAGFGLMHVLIATYVRCISQKPAINRFISGQKVFARNDIEINLTIKLEMTADAQETIIKIRPEPDATAEDIYNLITREVELSRAGSESDFDGFAKILDHIPGLFLKSAVWLIKFLDYFGLLPKRITDLSPFHGSMFITSMGSLGIPAIYHHLYDLGNVPVFCSFGAKKRRLELRSDGTVTERRCVTLTWVLDERICDGFNFASAFKCIRSILKNPFQLDSPPEQVVEDVD